MLILKIFISQYRKWSLFLWKWSPDSEFQIFEKWTHFIFDILFWHVWCMVLSLNGLFSTEFLLSVIVFELYSIAVKFVQKEALVDFLMLYHTVTCCKIARLLCNKSINVNKQMYCSNNQIFTYDKTVQGRHTVKLSHVVFSWRHTQFTHSEIYLIHNSTL
jgi:hypothetical protein